MKGLAKKIWAIVLSVVLVAGVVPTTVFAESTYGVLATGYHEYYPTTNDYNSLDNTRAEDGHGTVVLTDEHPTAVDENVWTKYNGYYGGGSLRAIRVLLCIIQIRMWQRFRFSPKLLTVMERWILHLLKEPRKVPRK